MENKKVILVCYGGGHVKIILPIARELVAKRINFVILAMTVAYKECKELFPEQTKRLRDYSFLFSDIQDKVKEFGLSILADNYREGIGIDREESIWYLGLSLFDLIDQHGKEKALKLYQEKKRRAFLPVKVMEKILSYEKPDVVLSTTAPRFEQASLIAGNNLGIKTIEVLNLFGDLPVLPEAQHIVCMNKSVSDTLRKRGLMDKKYYYYGQPAIEQTSQAVKMIDVDKIKKQISIDKPITILYATQKPMVYDENFLCTDFAGYQVINEGVFSVLSEIYKEFSVNILIRTHPNEDVNNYKYWLDKYSFMKVINNLNVEESIAVSDIVLTPFSTLGIEAIACKKSVFTFKYDLHNYFPVPTLLNKPFVFSDGFTELKRNLSNFLVSSSANTSADVANFCPTGSVKNIVSLICN